jgi:hypothetical protein
MLLEDMDVLGEMNTWLSTGRWKASVAYQTFGAQNHVRVLDLSDALALAFCELNHV